VGTFFLALFVFALIDEFNQPVLSKMAPFMIGMVVIAIAVLFGAMPATRSIPPWTSGRGSSRGSRDRGSW
jgi:glycerol uptake facilitator-like aquaporin